MSLENRHSEKNEPLWVCIETIFNHKFIPGEYQDFTYLLNVHDMYVLSVDGKHGFKIGLHTK